MYILVHQPLYNVLPFICIYIYNVYVQKLKARLDDEEKARELAAKTVNETATSTSSTSAPSSSATPSGSASVVPTPSSASVTGDVKSCNTCGGSFPDAVAYRNHFRYVCASCLLIVCIQCTHSVCSCLVYCMYTYYVHVCTRHSLF